MIKRREFIAGLGSAAVWPLVNEYSAYIPATSAAAEPARAFLAYLARPASRDTFKAAGVMP